MAHPATMIGRQPVDPAAVRCTGCGLITVACEAARSDGHDCCESCTHPE